MEGEKENEPMTSKEKVEKREIRRGGMAEGKERMNRGERRGKE